MKDVDRKASYDMNPRLLQKFTEDDIVAALKQIHLNKALGPDGLPNLFYP